MVPSPWEGGPSSEECAREVLSRGKWVRETRSGWANGAQPAGTCSSSSLSLHSVCASRLTGGNAYLRKAVGGLGGGNRSTWASPIDSRSAGSSRDGVAILRGTWAVVRARRPHDWAAPGCEQHAVTWTACDSRGGDGGRAVTCGVIVTPQPVDIRDRRSVVRAD